MTKLHSLHCSLLSVWRKGSAFAELMCRGVTIWVWQHSGTNLETQQSFTGHEADFMSKSTTITKLQALFRSGGVKQLLLFWI